MSSLEIRSEIDVRLLFFLLQAAVHKGISRDDVVKHIDLSKSCLDLPGSRMPISYLEEAINYIYQFSCREELGPRIGKIMSVEGMQFQLYISDICNTYRDYIKLAPKVNRLFGDIGSIEITRSDHLICCSWISFDENSSTDPLFGDAFLYNIINDARIYSIDPVPIVKVCLTHSEPKDRAMLESVYGENILFNQKVACVYLHESILDNSRIKLSSPVDVSIKESLGYLVDEEKLDDFFVDSVHRVLAQTLPTGESSINSVAAKLNISGRTLQRSLDKRNTTFLQELQTIRAKLASKYLKANKISITEIAFIVGYLDQSSFSTAFKSWFGTTPSEYRKSHN